MDYTLDSNVQDYQKRIRDFVNTHIIPVELKPDAYDEGENIADKYFLPLREKARAEGLWCLQMPKERGGAGLDTVGMAACYEEMGRSIFGPVVFNSAAPDDGNMFVLERVGTPAQKERWLQPIVDGKVRSALAMTEPAPGSGSDPLGMMLTKAEKSGDKWVVHGHKWFITGAGVAQHFILLARTSDHPRKGLTAFMFDRDDPGWELV
ncbi:MAG: acyl-CoA dehydrogenase, partial [Gammaproteobacteria bacterium]|nr:acyl-CoA dehydrogenase [Gammaproteobacteria bacterium]